MDSKRGTRQPSCDPSAVQYGLFLRLICFELKQSRCPSQAPGTGHRSSMHKHWHERELSFCGRSFDQATRVQNRWLHTTQAGEISGCMRGTGWRRCAYDLNKTMLVNSDVSSMLITFRFRIRVQMACCEVFTISRMFANHHVCWKKNIEKPCYHSRVLQDAFQLRSPNNYMFINASTRKSLSVAGIAHTYYRVLVTWQKTEYFDRSKRTR